MLVACSFCQSFARWHQDPCRKPGDRVRLPYHPDKDAFKAAANKCPSCAVFIKDADQIGGWVTGRWAVMGDSWNLEAKKVNEGFSRLWLSRWRDGKNKTYYSDDINERSSFWVTCSQGEFIIDPV